jgi:uncharacterized protein (TIGR03437 family)
MHRRLATGGWIISAGLLAIPCVAQPPGIVYSTTVPYSGPAFGVDYFPYPNVSQVVTDASGNTTIAGSVASSGLPTTPGVVQPGFAGGTCFSTPCPDAFIAKFDSNGLLIFLTYLGGTGSDIPYGLAVDAAGDIYINGQTTSTDFPLAGTPWRPVLSNQQGPSIANPFVAKLSGDGKTLIWSTILNPNLVQLALAPDGSVYYLLETVPTPSMPSAPVTYTLTKLTGDGQLVASFNAPFGASAVAIGADGSVYISGTTEASDVTATPGAWVTTYGGNVDGFAAKMNPNLSGFVWLTFVGGSGMGSERTFLSLMLLAPDGTLWVSGTTTDSSFPVLPGALQSQLSPGGTDYLVHLSADGSKALASTYLPGSLTSFALDPSGNVIFSGGGFQATPGAQWPCPQPAPGAPEPVFFGRIDSAGQHVLWGTWSGPSVPIGPVAVNANGNAIAAGNVPGQEDITLTAMTTVPGPPRLVETCIGQAAYPNASGPLAPGEIVSIYGAGFGPQVGVGAQPSGNAFGTELAGVQVLIENVPVPLLYVSAAQINLVAPYLLDGRVAAHTKIVTASATSNEVVLGVRPAEPEIFAILNLDGTVNSQDHPAAIGDFVAMFVSGVGQTNPPGVDGAIPTTAGGTPVLPITVQLQTIAAPSDAIVTYAGNAPGLISGLEQVNFQIPFLVPPTTFTGVGPPYQATVVLSVGGTTAGGAVIWFD